MFKREHDFPLETILATPDGFGIRVVEHLPKNYLRLRTVGSDLILTVRQLKAVIKDGELSVIRRGEGNEY